MSCSSKSCASAVGESEGCLVTLVVRVGMVWSCLVVLDGEWLSVGICLSVALVDAAAVVDFVVVDVDFVVVDVVVCVLVCDCDG